MGQTLTPAVVQEILVFPVSSFILPFYKFSYIYSPTKKQPGMTRTILSYYLLVVFTSMTAVCIANPKVDSLLSLLEKAEGTAKFDILNNLTKEYRKNDPVKALEYANKSLAYAEQLGYMKGKGSALSNLGLLKKDLGAFDEAEALYLRAHHIYTELSDTGGLAAVTNNLGTIYQKKAFYEKALEHFFKALQFHEHNGDKHGMASVLNNISTVYVEQRRYSEALAHYEKILELCRQTNEAFGEALIHNNMGVAYEKMRDHEKALHHFERSYVIFKELNHLYGVGNALRGMGSVLNALGRHNEALKWLNEGLQIRIQLNEKRGISQSHTAIGTVFLSQKKPAEAIPHFNEGLKYAEEIGEKVLLAEAYKGLYEAWRMAGNKARAFDYLAQYAQLKDSIYDHESTENLARMQALYENSKKEKEIVMLNKDRELKDIELSKKETEIRHQNTQKIAFAGGCFLLLLLALFIYRGYSQKKKANEIISLQKEQVELQKAVIEEKNKDITDSIHYARRIQKAMLPTVKLMNESLPEHFVLFQPKDIVSGDFYWASRPASGNGQAGKILFAAADCTGHGVPGAFMSLIGTSFLNEIVLKKNIHRPDLVLNELRHNIITALNPEGNEHESKDGMDITLCALDRANMLLEYASAFNGLYIIRQNELADHPADKFPVGMFGEENKPFTLRSIVLQPGDCIYIFSDGYADQFGGPDGKKFKYARLKALLKEIDHRPMSEQKQVLEDRFNQWKNGLEQVDDVCVIGVRI